MTTVEVYAAEFFRVIEENSITNFSDVSDKELNRIALYRHIKSKIHLATIYQKNQFKTFYPNKIM